jgi:hypothetical protein
MSIHDQRRASVPGVDRNSVDQSDLSRRGTTSAGRPPRTHVSSGSRDPGPAGSFGYDVVTARRHRRNIAYLA